MNKIKENVATLKQTNLLYKLEKENKLPKNIFSDSNSNHLCISATYEKLKTGKSESYIEFHRATSIIANVLANEKD